MKKIKQAPFRVGEWLPSDQAVQDAWLDKLIAETDRKPKRLHPVVQEFQDMIESDADLYMFFTQMFNQVPRRPPYNLNPAGKPQVRNYRHALRLINAILTKAPRFNESGLVGFPINAIFDWSMATTGGYAAFLNDKVNRQLEKILDVWGRFLRSKRSRNVLNKNPKTGWLGDAAMKAMFPKASNPRKAFEKTFKCQPRKRYYGFGSWDDFFLREFRKGVRPVAAPRNDAVIANACESAPYRVAYSVRRRDNFWIKAQPYSLEHMLDHHHVDEFVGGTIYQAFLSALSYHRWNSPVNGTVVEVHKIPGTYYSETLAEGFDPSGPNESQGYIAEVATRALIFIEADNPDIGLMCFMPVGMAEVSTCDVTVTEGQRVKKGQPIGMFHFGGSTHCLIFRPKVRLAFDLHGQQPGLDSKNIPVNARIATVCG